MSPYEFTSKTHSLSTEDLGKFSSIHSLINVLTLWESFTKNMDSSCCCHLVYGAVCRVQDPHPSIQSCLKNGTKQVENQQKVRKKLKTKNRNNIVCGTRGCLEGPNLNIETGKNLGEERGKCRKMKKFVHSIFCVIFQLDLGRCPYLEVYPGP